MIIYFKKTYKKASFDLVKHCQGLSKQIRLQKFDVDWPAEYLCVASSGVMSLDVHPQVSKVSKT